MTADAPSRSAAFLRAITHRVVPAVPVPFTPGGVIDAAAQAAYVAWMARQPVGAVAVWAHTGRGLLLSDEERDQVLAAWRSGAAALPVVCGVGVPRGVPLSAEPRARTDRVIAAAVALAEAARRGGASAVLLHPPSALADLPGVADRVVAVHTAVAGVGLPVLAFDLYAAAGGLPYPPAVLERLLALEGVVGVKIATLDSVMRFQDVVPVVQRGGALLVTGEDRFLGYSLMLGARAALVGIAAACTDRCAALLAAWFDGDATQFVRHARALDAFAAATFVEPMEGYVQRMWWAVEADGVLAGGATDRFAPALPNGERERVIHAVRVLRAG